MASQAEAPTWLSVGAVVDRELDDFCNIWAAAKVTALYPCGCAADIAYEDGCVEEAVPVEELRMHVEEAEVSEAADGLGADKNCVEEEGSVAEAAQMTQSLVAVVGGGAAPRRGSLTASMSALRCESRRLVQRLGSLSDVVPKALVNLGVASSVLMQTAMGLRSTVRSLRQVSRALTMQADPVFTDLAKASSEEQSSPGGTVNLRRPAGPATYMLPVVQKKRGALQDGIVLPSMQKRSSSTVVVGSPGRSFLRRRPESRGAQQSSAMMLDLGVESAAAQRASTPSGLSPARLSKGVHSSLEPLPFPSPKAPLRLPSLSRAGSKGRGAAKEPRLPMLGSGMKFMV